MNRIKSKSAAALAAALALVLSAPAHAVSWSGNDGWEVHYSGFVNLFYNQLNFENPDGTNEEDSALLNEGLLPSFHTMKAKSPTVNGLTGTSQITFAVDTSTDKGVNLNKGEAGAACCSPGTDTLIDLREVFFNVEGGFGTFSVGRTLALFQRQAILKDITLFGVGGMADPDANGTGLGRIGAGYVYPDFRARFLWQSNEVNGFQASLGVFQPRETGSAALNSSTTTTTSTNVNLLTSPQNLAITGTAGSDPITVTGATINQITTTMTPVAGELETDIPMFQGEVTMNADMGGAAFNAWAGFLWQQAEVLGGVYDGEEFTSLGGNVGGQLSMAGLTMTASYYRGQGLGTLFMQQADSIGCIGGADAKQCSEAENHGGYGQVTYMIPHGGDSKTTLGVSWGYSETEVDKAANGWTKDQINKGYSGGVYHDVNSWLKLIVEYNNYEYRNLLTRDVQGASLGAFMFW